MFEYEKLLITEENRKQFNKATTMVKFGLFSQSEEPDFSFENLELLTLAKKFKGLYDLYENQITGELIFVNPLVENNAGDSEFEQKLKPYAYDVIRIENVTDDEYSQILVAGAHEKSITIDSFYIVQIVFIILSAITTLVYTGYNIYSGISAGNGVGFAIFNSLFLSNFMLYVLLGIEIGIFTLTSIKYRQYKSEK